MPFLGYVIDRFRAIDGLLYLIVMHSVAIVNAVLQLFHSLKVLMLAKIGNMFPFGFVRGSTRRRLDGRLERAILKYGADALLCPELVRADKSRDDDVFKIQSVESENNAVEDCNVKKRERAARGSPEEDNTDHVLTPRASESQKEFRHEHNSSARLTELSDSVVAGILDKSCSRSLLTRAEDEEQVISKKMLNVQTGRKSNDDHSLSKNISTYSSMLMEGISIASITDLENSESQLFSPKKNIRLQDVAFDAPMPPSTNSTTHLVFEAIGADRKNTHWTFQTANDLLLNRLTVSQRGKLGRKRRLNKPKADTYLRSQSLPRNFVRTTSTIDEDTKEFRNQKISSETSFVVSISKREIANIVRPVVATHGRYGYSKSPQSTKKITRRARIVRCLLRFCCCRSKNRDD